MASPRLNKFEVSVNSVCFVPTQFGETWYSNCQKCTCNADTLSVQCEPVKCPAQEIVTCKKYGEVLVNETVDCCQINTCGE